MLDHIMLRVRNYQKSRDFYDAVLATLGYKRLMEFGGKHGGYGDTKPYFWIGEDENPHPRTHIAFMSKDRPSVDAFHAAAVELGAKSDGAPGIRAEYHENYYGAFVFDPDGNNIEAVCHAPEKAAKRSAAKTKGAARKVSAAKGKGKAKPAKKKSGSVRARR